METKGLHKATTYVFHQAIGTAGYLTWAQCQEMYAAGWDIGNHGEHSDFTTLTQEEIEAELNATAAALVTNSVDRAKLHVAYPFGLYDADSDAAMDATGMLTGRLGSGMSFDPASAPDTKRIPSVAVGLTTPLGNVKVWIGDAVQDGKVLVLQFHKIVETPSNGTEWSIANYRALMDWIASENIQLSTISEMYSAVYG